MAFHGKVCLRMGDYCLEVLHCKWPVHVEGQCGPSKAVPQNSSTMQIFKLQHLVMLRKEEY